MHVDYLEINNKIRIFILLKKLPESSLFSSEIHNSCKLIQLGHGGREVASLIIRQRHYSAPINTSAFIFRIMLVHLKNQMCYAAMVIIEVYLLKFNYSYIISKSVLIKSWKGGGRSSQLRNIQLVSYFHFFFRHELPANWCRRKDNHLEPSRM